MLLFGRFRRSRHRDLRVTFSHVCQFFRFLIAEQEIRYVCSYVISFRCLDFRSERFGATIPWMEFAFGLQAFPGSRDVPGFEVSLPKLYAERGKRLRELVSDHAIEHLDFPWLWHIGVGDDVIHQGVVASDFCLEYFVYYRSSLIADRRAFACVSGDFLGDFR